MGQVLDVRARILQDLGDRPLDGSRHTRPARVCARNALLRVRHCGSVNFADLCL